MEITVPAAADKPKKKEQKILFLRFPLKEQILFAKRLSLLQKSGVPLLRGLRMIAAQTKAKNQKYIMETLSASVERGQYLSTSLEQFRKIFGGFFINIIQVGEMSGTLQENLAHLSEELQKRMALRRKVRSAMVYPAIIIVATFGISILLTVFLFPKILPIFESLDFQLPWTTRALIFISSFIIKYWIFLIIGAVLAVAAFFAALGNDKFKFRYHQLLLKLPIFGNLLKHYYLANICRTFGLLLRTDVRIVRALQITAETSVNIVYRKQLLILADRVTDGQRISGHMVTEPKLFPIMLTQLVEVGENTGNLPDTFNFLAEMYDNEVDDLTKNLSTILEPALMVVMGLIVGFVAISIITPIYGFTQNIHP